MKLGVFTDPHYSGADTVKEKCPRLSIGKMKDAFAAFKAANVDLVVCLGDSLDHCSSHGEALGLMNEIKSLVRSAGVPFCAIPGNHDYQEFSAQELVSFGVCVPPCAEMLEGVCVILLDANYRSDMRRFDVAGAVWTDANLPPEQLAFLEKTLAATDKPCIVLIHECLDPAIPETHRVNNADAVRAVLEASGKVKLVLEGHYHAGGDSVINGIRYCTVPGMCVGEQNSFVTVDWPAGTAEPIILSQE